MATRTEMVQGPEREGAIDTDTGVMREYPVARTTEFKCDLCSKAITHSIRALCRSSGKDICLQCMIEGTEDGSHKANSPYSIIDCLGDEIYEKGWEIAEELALLEGIGLYGFGNWCDVAVHVRSKTEAECRDHFDRIYIQSSGQPKLLHADKGEVEVSSSGKGKGIRDGPQDVPNIGEADSDTLNGRTQGRESDYQCSGEQKKLGEHGHSEISHSARTAAAARRSESHVIGYWPLRGDFDIEYDNDAEKLLSTIRFTENDSDAERELKLKIVEFYNARLARRQDRKNFVIERGLVSRKKQPERRKPKDEREVYDRMKSFARFHSPEQHEEFVRGLIMEMRLRERIKTLREYRENGVLALADGESFELERKKRHSKMALKKQREESYYYSGPDRRKRIRPQSDGTDFDYGHHHHHPHKKKKKKKKKIQSADEDAAHGEPPKIITLKPTDAGSELEGDKLAPEEVRLCSHLRLPPAHYLAMKRTILQECLHHGFLQASSGSQRSQRLHVDVTKTGIIYDWFVDCGVTFRGGTVYP